MRFYDVISELNNNTENRMITVCDGVHAGEKMIVSGGKCVWTGDDDGFFAEHAEETVTAKDWSLTEIGGARVFSELLCNEKEIVICGAGHVSIPVITTAKMLGFRVTVIDDREQFTKNAERCGADTVLCMDFDEALSKIPGSADTYFVILTRGHRHDTDCLLLIAKKPHAYIGMIGSRRKVSMVREHLASEGIPQEVIDAVRMPIGLDIGAETPEEIAVAIMGEITQVKNAKNRNTGFTRSMTDALQSESRGPAVLATIISKEGSSPRGAGTRMLTGRDGIIAGTIGGGLAEARAIERSKEMLSECAADKKEKSRPVIMKVDMSGKDIEDEGMICGGAIEVMLEIV